MRGLVLAISFLACQLALAQNSNNWSLKFENTPLPEVLDYLESTYGVSFAYDAEALSAITVTINVQEGSPKQVLQILLQDQGWSFKRLQGNYVIIPRPEQGSIDLSGKLFDAASNEPLPFANVWVPALGRGTTTNVEGYFLLRDLTDTTTLILSYLGFEPIRIRVSDWPQDSRLTLRSKEELLPELLVQSAIDPMQVNESPSHITFNPRLLAGLPTLGETDVLRSLQLLPGISATNETSSGLVVRGGTPDQNLILFDGFSVFQLDHFFGVFSAFNTLAIKDIQLYKSGFDARYGGSTSSVLDITGKSGDAQKLRLGLSASLVSINGSLETPLGKKWTLLVAGRRAFTDVIQSRLYKNLVETVRNDENNSPRKQLFDGDDLQPRFYFYDTNIKLTFRPSDRDVLSLSLYDGQDNLELEAARQEGFVNVSIQDEAEWGNNGGSIRWARQWNPAFYGQVRFSWSEYGHITSYNSVFNYDDGTNQFEAGQVNDITNDVTLTGLNLDFDWQLSKKSQLLFGLSAEGLTSQLKDGNQDVLDIDQEGELVSMYWQHQWKPWPRLSLNTGLRYFYFDLLDDGLWDPRVNASYQVNDKLSLKGAWGKYHQITNRIINSDINTGLPDFWLLADAGSPILVKDSEHAVLGFNYRREKWSIDIEAYHKTLNGLVDFIPLGRYFAAEFLPSDQFVAGRSTSKGIDFLFQYENKSYTHWTAYSLGRVDDLLVGLNNNQEFPSNLDQRHEFKSVHLLKLGSWKLSGSWIYATGKPFTGPRGYYEVQTPVGNQTFFDASSINSFRLPDYHRLDLSATYSFDWGNWQVESGLSLYNLYNRRNIKFKRFEITNIDPLTGTLLDNQQVFSYDVTMLGFTPNFFINFKL